MKRIVLVAAGLTFVLTNLAGCQHLPFGFQFEHGHSPTLAAYANQLAEQDASERAQKLEQAYQAFEQNATPVTHARLGLALGQPGYAGHDPDAARKHLKTALSAETANWTNTEGALLSLRLQQIARLANQRTEWQSRLQTSQNKARELAHKNQNLREGLQTTRNKLKAALDKLEAITQIEQDLGLRKYDQ